MSCVGKSSRVTDRQRDAGPQSANGSSAFARAIALLSSVLFAAVSIIIAAQPASAVSIKLNDVAPDRIERQRLAAAGQLPLPGTPAIGQRKARLESRSMKAGLPVLIRIFKEESELELWMMKNGRFELFATYPVCHWSGTLGPKLSEGDKQAPEGFYTVNRRSLHRSGRWPRSLNLGFPNAYDRSLSRTGSYILVHGGCSSVGCYAMTNAVIEEIHHLTKAAIRAGQKHVPVHVFPFRMNKENMQRHSKSDWIGFWSELKQGYDSFERTRLAPSISVCNGRYEVRDADPPEVGAPGPLAVCGETAAILQAEALLQSVVSHPSRWRTLSASERKTLQKLIAGSLPPKARSSGRTSKRGKTAGRKRALSCNLARPSCRRYLMLQRRKHAPRHYARKR